MHIHTTCGDVYVTVKLYEDRVTNGSNGCPITFILHPATATYFLKSNI